MTNFQESRLSMYVSFKDFQPAYSAITSPLPNYTDRLEVFSGALVKIQGIAENQKLSKNQLLYNKHFQVFQPVSLQLF